MPVLLRDALRCDHAPIVFANPSGTLRNLSVTTLWDRPEDAKFCPREGTMGWDDSVVVTNDGALLAYLQATHGRIPTFPAAGDRPACFLDPRLARAGVVNSGGPAPGLCMVNDSITKRHFALAAEYMPVVLGYRGGFKGLALQNGTTSNARLVPSAEQRRKCPEADAIVTDDCALDPVTFLGSSRFDLRKAPNLRNVLDGIKHDRLDILYVVGGNGSQAAAQRIKEEVDKEGYRGPLGHPLAIIGGPKTMDNDLLCADTTFGYQTTVDHTVHAAGTFHATVECLDRVGMMQVFGAASGYVSLYASYCSGVVDYPAIPEVVERTGIWALARDPRAAEAIIENARFIGADRALRAYGLTREEVFLAGILVVMRHMGEVISSRHDLKRHALVVVAEGCKGVFAHSGASRDLMPFSEMVQDLAKDLNQRPHRPHGDVQVTAIEPTYLIRDNPPRSYDVTLCKVIGKAMADAALAGYTNCLVARWCGRYVLVPMSVATSLVNMIDPSDYFYRSMASRFKVQLDEDYVARQWPDLVDRYHTRYTQRLADQVRLWAAAMFSNSDESIQRVARALDLAAHAHAGTTRKHGGPFVVHAYRVAVAACQQMASGKLPESSSLIAAALLHDVLEDARDRVSGEMIEAACGREALELVLALTGPTKQEVPDAMERSRLKAERATLGKQPAIRLKLLDRLDNLADVCRLNDHSDGPALRARLRRETIAHFLPLVDSLDDPDLVHSLDDALSHLKES